MTAPRACSNCRTSKVRCDGALPKCGRCARRRLTSCDASSQRQFVFRDETSTAQRLSERARGHPADTGGASFAHPQSDYSSAEARRTSTFTPDAPDSLDLPQSYPWLNESAIAELPEPLKRDIETRAIERFFVDWTIHPSALSPGHMHHLPMLYGTSPADSVLPLVVQAVAFAGTRNARDMNNTPFSVKAQRSYGAALARMRTIAHSQQDFADDRVLAALLLFDSYESVYLAKSDLLGSHSDAIQFIMYARGFDQLHHQQQFCLWRVANWQLQARQILHGEAPNPVQEELVSKLNLDRPELHISADVLQMSALCAAAKQMLADHAVGMDRSGLENVERTAFLLQNMSNLLNTMGTWTSQVTGPWQPDSLDTLRSTRPRGGIILSSDLRYTCPFTFHYTDSSLACIWNFYSACQIVLRERCIDLILLSCRLANRHGPSSADLQSINEHKEAIGRLSGSIIRSVPLLMGFADAPSTSKMSPAKSYQGTMVARYLGLFTMIVIQRAEHTSDQHKATASKVMERIWTRHRLGI